MKFSRYSRACLLVGALGSAATILPALAAGETTAAAPASTQRDGSHDFDFNFGTWKTHITRVLDPFSSDRKTMELNGTVRVRKVWGGRAQLEEIEADGPKGHWEGMTLWLYNPEAHQWSQNFINSKMGALNAPSIGSFKDGRGELFSQDTLNDRSILLRVVWSDIKPDSHQYEESYSNDGGKTWAQAFTANKTRDKSPPPAMPAPATDESAKQAGNLRDGAHDFDFDFGTWKTHSSRLLHPLTGSKKWVDMDGTTTVSKIWGGKANLAEYKATGSAGTVELLALRWYNPTAHQWNLDFATTKGGVLGNIPGVGELQDGKLVFYDQEPVNGKAILVRFSIWGITPDTAQSEQALSADGGTTWETNWINKYTRIAQ